MLTHNWIITNLSGVAVVFCVTFLPFSDHKILIVGAGISGISAGKKLYDAGYRNFKIVEATDRIGGRLKHAYIGNTAVEMGASWIYGMGSNPLYELMVKYNVSSTIVNDDDRTILNDAGENVTVDANRLFDEIHNAWILYRQYATEARISKRGDFTLSAAARHFGWRPENSLQDAVEFAIFDYETGIHPTAKSGKYVYYSELFEDFDSDIICTVVNDQRGLSHVVKKLFESYNDTSDRLLFKKTVHQISHSDSNVQILMKDGEVLTADYVIVTFSLGVLQHRLVQFSPPLPDAKQMAIDKFGMADYSHVYVKYTSAFWSRTQHIIFASKVRGKLSIWMNINSIIPNCNILQIVLIGEFSRWADHSTDTEVLAEIKTTIKQMYPTWTAVDPVAYAISRWSSDPHFKGSFNYWPPAFTEEDMVLLGMNVGRVYFAGEHTHALHYGFAHGALMSGTATANDLIKCIEDPDICSKQTSGATVYKMSVIEHLPIVFLIISFRI